jgi:hypothetical protein
LQYQMILINSEKKFVGFLGAKDSS